MIIDVLENATMYMQINNRFRKAFDFLKNTNLLELNPGKYEIEGNEIYASVDTYYTVPIEKKMWEAHRRYIDIQFLIKNSEQMGYAHLEQMKQITEYDEDKDLVFYKGNGNFFTVNPGIFVIFFPQDAHMPGVEIGQSKKIKKIVIKVLAD